MRVTGWFKSSFSKDASTCVEVRFDETAVLIRDSKYQGDPAFRPVISLPRGDWRYFLEAAAGRAVEPWRGLPTIEHANDGLTTLHAADGTALTYFPDEWRSFCLGIGIGEFTI